MKRKARRKRVAPSSRGLGPREVRAESPPAAIEKLAALVESDGAAVIGSYREPLGGQWQLFVALPIDKLDRLALKHHAEQIGRSHAEQPR